MNAARAGRTALLSLAALSCLSACGPSVEEQRAQYRASHGCKLTDMQPTQLNVDVDDHRKETVEAKQFAWTCRNNETFTEAKRADDDLQSRIDQYKKDADCHISRMEDTDLFVGYTGKYRTPDVRPVTYVTWQCRIGHGFMETVRR